VQKLRIEDDLADQVPDGHMLHVVLKKLCGYAAQVVKGADVPVQDALQGAAVDELGIDCPGKAPAQNDKTRRNR
jgi:hypothetical protein